MRNSVRVASIGGIDIGIHYSWLLVFFLVAWTLAAGLFPQQYPGLGSSSYWLMGIVASVLFFLSVLVHELAHSFMATSRGLKVTNITLFIFGGVSNIAEEPRSAAQEFLVAIVGPVSSLILAAIFWGLDRTSLASLPQTDGVLSYLSYINATLAIFNLIPGFPLDGGRVLRAILWGVLNSLPRATKIASGVGRVVAFVFILGGIFMAINGDFIGGLWLMFIGWFLSSMAETASQQTDLAARLRGIAVADVMNAHPMVAEPATRLSELVHDHVLARGIRAIPVVEDGRLAGMITLHEVQPVPMEEWGNTPARFVMKQLPDLHTATPREPVYDALRAMTEHDVNQLPVVEDGRLAGMLRRSDVLRFLQVREELGLAEPERRRAA